MATNEEILRLDLDTRPAEASAGRYRRTLDEVRNSSKGVAESTDDSDRKFRALAAGGMGVAALAASRLSRGMSGMASIARGVGSQIVSLTEVGLRGMSRGLRALAEGMTDANGDLTMMGRTTAIAATGLEKLAGVMETVSRIALGMKLAVAASVTALVIASHRAAAEFEPGFNRVRTLLTGTGQDMELLSAEVSNMAGRIGVAGRDATDTLYEVFSALPDLAKAPTEAMDILAVSLEVGATGFASAADAASATTAIINAFGKEAKDAEMIASALWATQDQGVTTFGELAGSIGRVGPLAASLGADFRDLLGIVATITPRGIETAEAMTQIRGALSNILRPSADATEAAKELGIQFDAAAVQAKGLERFLLDIIDATDGKTDLLARLFGSQEALALMVSLSGATEELQQKIDMIGDSAGLHAQKVDTMNDSWARQKEILGEGFRTGLRNIGDDFQGIGTVGLKAVNGLVSAFNALHLSMERTALLPDFLDRLKGIGEEIDTWLDQMFGKERVIRVTIGEITIPRRPVENAALIGLDKSVLDYDEMQRRTEEIARGHGVARPLAPIDEAAIRRAEAKVERERERLQGGWDSIADDIRHMAAEYRVWIDEMSLVAVRVGAAEIGHGLTRGRDQYGRPPVVSETLLNADSVQRGRVDAARIRELERQAEEASNTFARTTSDVARGIIEVGDAFGVLDDQTRRALTGITSLVAGLDGLDSSKGLSLANLGSIVGIVGAVAQVGAAMFGQSAALQQNSRALEALQRSIEGSLTRSDEQRALAVIDRFQAAPIGDRSRIWRDNKDLLTGLASELGLTIDTGDINGSLRQLEEALRLATDRMFEFGKSLDQQRAQQDAYREIFDLTDPKDVLASEYGLMDKFASDLLKQYGAANLNMESDAGRATYEAALREIFTDYSAGTLDKDLLGEFSSGQEFVDLLLQSDRALDAFAKGLDEATRATTDIPKAINLALYQQRYATGAGGPAMPPEGPAILDPIRGPGGGGGGNGSGRGREGAHVYYITIDGSGLTGEQLLEEVERAAQTRIGSGGEVVLR